jgi:hypothetical protein
MSPAECSQAAAHGEADEGVAATVGAVSDPQTSTGSARARRPTTAYAVLLALPGLSLAVAGLFHPHSLSYATSGRWTVLHVAGLVVFPLVGAALAVLVRGRTDPVAWLVRLGAYVYATAYSALDVISGIGAGYVTWRLGPDQARPDEVRHLFAIGGRIGEVGSWALIACAVVVLGDAVRRLGVSAWPGALLLPGAWLVHVDHIFSPGGAVGMALLGLGTAGLATAAGRRG